MIEFKQKVKGQPIFIAKNIPKNFNNVTYIEVGVHRGLHKYYIEEINEKVGRGEQRTVSGGKEAASYILSNYGLNNLGEVINKWLGGE